MDQIKVELIPSDYSKEDNTLDVEKVRNAAGHYAGVCYEEEGYNKLLKEDPEKTEKRAMRALKQCHHSVFGHTHITLNIENIPKILAMILNNEKEYNTSEKSARYTPVVRTDNSVITKTEEELYNKWMGIFTDKIIEEYPDSFKPFKIKTLSQENARYLVTTFMPTKMIYTTSIRQINYIVSWMFRYINENGYKSEFNNKLCDSMMDFIFELERLHIVIDGLLTNDKNRSLSLFGKDLDKKEIHYGENYSTLYKASFASAAQANRHRSISYQIEMADENNKKYFIPPILEDNDSLVNEWLTDMEKVKDVTPQGELVKVYECDSFENLIQKAKERLCTHAQLEIMRQTRKTLEEYYNNLSPNCSLTKEDIKKYLKGARCTFSDYNCDSDCKFKEGKTLKRKI